MANATRDRDTGDVMYIVTEKKFTFLIQQTPYFAIEVMRTMAERLRRMNATL